MKLTALIALIACMHVSANSFSQTISLSVRKVPLESILTEIMRQAGVSIIYNDTLLNNKPAVSLHVKDATLQEALDKCLANLDLAFTVKGRNIILRQKDHNMPAPPKPAADTAAPVIITGSVLNEKGEPMPGITVRLKGTSRGAISDTSGRFNIPVSNKEDSLIFTFLGYKPKVVSAGNAKNTIIRLEPDDNSKMREVVVVGYGTQKKVSLTSAVGIISAEDLSKRVVNNTQQSLQGLSPGMTVLDQGGAPGRASVTMRIRGITTLSGNNPLILVDGIEQGINNLNPDDIENVSILKDAAATSIYGSRAATGVVLITTRRAKEGQINVAYNGYYAIQQLGNHPQGMTTEQYMRQQNVAYVNAGQAAPYTEDYIKEYISSSDKIKYPEANVWYDVLYKKAPQYNNNFTLSGGSKQFKALMDIRYMKQEGITDKFSNDVREVRLNTDFIPSDKFKFSVDADYRMLYSTQPQDAANVFYNTLHGAQFVTPRYPDGGYGVSAQGNNPLISRDLSGYDNDYYNQFTANLQGSWNIVKGLTFSTQYGVVSTNDRTKVFKAAYAVVDENYPSRTKTVATNSLTEGRSNGYTETLNSLLQYKLTLGKHNFSLLGGYSQIYTNTNSLTGFRNTFYNNDIQALSAGAASSKDNSGSDAIAGLRSYFTRFNYNFNDKYLLELNGRYDGSSNFTGDNLYSFFPSFSAGWRLSQEKFWRPLSYLIPEFKLRGSYGRTGNQTVSAYSFYESLTTLNYNFSGTAATGYALLDYANTAIAWETTTQTDLGFDATILHNKLDVVFDYYNKKTTGILLSLAIPGAIGLNTPVQNAGVVSNKGWELGLNYHDHSHPVQYAINFNISNNINKVVDLAGTGPYITGSTNDGLYANQVGLPIGVLWGFKTKGLYKDADDVKNSAKYDNNTYPGDLKYVDLNGDGKISADDRTMIGDPFPHYTFGFTSSLQYKNFDFYLFIQGAIKQDARVSGAFADAGNNQGFVIDIENDYWTPENPNARFARPQKFTDKNAQISDFWVVKMGYARVKNLQLGYTLPASVLQHLKIKKARLYLSGSNLFTFSQANEWGIDPEFPTGRGNYYPQTKTFTFGANINF
ncbi:MAG: TonB-dependent receptor [Bacteroidetes bacterium]|nr:TonB-dependent receptor [Bacteroidota bacterium]